MCPECKKKHLKWPATCELRAAMRVVAGRDNDKYDQLMYYCRDNNLKDPNSDLPFSYSFGS